MLNFQEKKFLLAVERGDVASTRYILPLSSFNILPVLYLIFYRRMLEEQASLINIDCMDPLGKDVVLDSRILASSLKKLP